MKIVSLRLKEKTIKWLKEEAEKEEITWTAMARLIIELKEREEKKGR